MQARKLVPSNLHKKVEDDRSLEKDNFNNILSLIVVVIFTALLFIGICTPWGASSRIILSYLGVSELVLQEPSPI